MMMLEVVEVVEFPSEKLDDENVYFLLNIYFNFM